MSVSLILYWAGLMCYQALYICIHILFPFISPVLSPSFLPFLSLPPFSPLKHYLRFMCVFLSVLSTSIW